MAASMPPEHTPYLTKSYLPRPAWPRSVLDKPGSPVRYVEAEAFVRLSFPARLRTLKMADLTNKVSLVTGGSRGIGAGIAKRLAADGASVAITYTRGAEAAASVVQEIERGGRKAIAIQADPADAKAVLAAVEKTFATFGRLDVLVNNAGTAIPKPFEEATLEEMDRVIDINIRGV